MKFIFITFFLLINASAYAKGGDLWLQGRLFIANTNVSPDNLNTALKSEGLKTLSKTTNFGVEITFPISRFFEPGMRYTHRLFSVDEDPSSSTTTYELDGKQDSILFLGRIPIIRSPMLRLDAFAGVGGNNTKMTLDTATHNGTYSKTAPSDWYASPYYAYGGSFGIGLHSILLYAEAGYESNVVKKFTTSGNVNTSITEVNLSGNYFMIGIMFDGIKGFKK